MQSHCAGRWRRAIACALAILSLAATSVAADSKLEERSKEIREIVNGLIDHNNLTAMVLSPDGRHIVVTRWNGYVNSMLLVDTDTLSARRLIDPETRRGWTAPIQPMRARWISNDQLAVDFNDGECDVVGFDGKRGLQLGVRFIRMLDPDKPGGPRESAVVWDQTPLGNPQLRRINVRTGKSVKIPLDLPDTVQWVLFDNAGHVRAVTTQETHWFVPGAKIANWYRHDDQSPWQKLDEAPASAEFWRPVDVSDDSDTLVVSSRAGRDTWAMFDYDVATRRSTGLRIGHPTEDLARYDLDDAGDTVRVVAKGLKPDIYWLDARWDQLQRSVDAALPGAVNFLNGDPQGQVLIYSYSDRDPGRWLLLDTHALKLVEVGRSRSRVDPARMRPMQTISYVAADGLKIPAYLTLPAQAARSLPMVVYIHGGPTARDEWGWDFDVQALAAAGYAVLQPQFRGSSGFGRKFEEAGYRQWGLAMQDDITAGVKAMISNGIADPDRICIYGASYGGYAALWGLVKTPELYRCGASLAGVTDIGERFSDHSDTNDDKAAQEVMRFEVGDLETMKSQFDAVSPERHADRITVPVLLAHGTDDRRVPIGHAKRMADALTDAHKEVETHWYDDEGHGLAYTNNIVDFEKALLAFLDRNIGPTSAVGIAKAASAASGVLPAVAAASGAAGRVQ